MLMLLSLSLSSRLQLLRRQRRDTAAAQPAAPHITMSLLISVSLQIHFHAAADICDHSLLFLTVRRVYDECLEAVC